MKKIIQFVFLVMICHIVNAGYSDSLISITKQEFEGGTKESSIKSGLNFKKKNGILRIPGCKHFKDDNADENFCEYNHVGNIGKNFRFTIIRKTSYNGEEYLVINNKSNCAIYNLLGKPHLFSPFIINFNDSETTDRKKIIEIWKIEEDKVIKLKDILFSKNLVFTSVKMDLKNTIYLKDHLNEYWKVSF